MIVATTRTRNESRNIERFCQSYQWADAILIADGGSEDDTVAKASRMPKTQVRSFTERAYRGEFWRNPHGRHINFLIDWAKEVGAEWIIFDDCDCFPNYAIQAEGKSLFDLKDKHAIYVNRVYVWGTREYFEGLTKPTGDFVGSLWAWRLATGLRACEHDAFSHHFSTRPPEESRQYYAPPYCLMHHFAYDDEDADRKLTFYFDTLGIQRIHPIKMGGELLTLEAWMH